MYFHFDLKKKKKSARPHIKKVVGDNQTIIFGGPYASFVIRMALWLGFAGLVSKVQ